MCFGSVNLTVTWRTFRPVPYWPAYSEQILIAQPVSNLGGDIGKLVQIFHHEWRPPVSSANWFNRVGHSFLPWSAPAGGERLEDSDRKYLTLARARGFFISVSV